MEAERTAAAAREAAAIGGHAGDEELDPVARPLAEGGEGVAEGFQLVEEELIKAAERADGPNDPLADALAPEVDGGAPRGISDEADHK